MRAFRKAVENPLVESVEFDVRTTKDGVLVVDHGAELTSMPGVKVESLTWEEVRTNQIKPGDEEDHNVIAAPEAASNDFLHCKRHTNLSRRGSSSILPWPSHTQNDNTTPSLQEVVNVCMGRARINCEKDDGKKVYMNVEIKAIEIWSVEEHRMVVDEKATADIVKEALALLHGSNAIGKTPAETNCKISSFEPKVLRQVQQWRSEQRLSVPVGQLYNNGDAYDEVKYPRHFYIELHGDKIQYFQRDPTPEKFWEHLEEGDWVNFCAETVSKEEVEKAHSQGLKVMVWFPGVSRIQRESQEKAGQPPGEDLVLLRDLQSIGVDTVCTNRPSLWKDEGSPDELSAGYK